MGTTLLSLLTTIGVVTPSGAFIAATIDYAGIGSLVAAVSAFIALYLSHKNNKRNAKNTETVSYVDNNLKTMQTTLDWVTAENQRLREVNEEQRLQLEEFADELNGLHDELRRCRDECSALSMRMDRKIGKDDDTTDPA